MVLWGIRTGSTRRQWYGKFQAAQNIKVWTSIQLKSCISISNSLGSSKCPKTTLWIVTSCFENICNVRVDLEKGYTLAINSFNDEYWQVILIGAEICKFNKIKNTFWVFGTVIFLCRLILSHKQPISINKCCSYIFVYYKFFWYRVTVKQCR